MSTYDLALFVGLPYAAFLLFVCGTIYRYRATKFQVSALSSQFLEGQTLFWGIIPFHIGIIICFFGHLLAFLLPQQLLMWNSVPVRLFILEATGIAFALCAFIGMLALFARRVTNTRIRMVTNNMDLVLGLLFLAQIFFGLWISIGYRWGSSWFAADLTPYLWSVITFQPDASAVAAMPIMIKAHIVGAFLILAVFPFTRLIHILVAPFHYLVRPYQQVIWYWDRKKVRSAATPWSDARPRNN